ncbi:MAG: response regulator [Bacteroidetes bacterium]|nr:MAG: response regulator [Bacteroidota bacterium]
MHIDMPRILIIEDEPSIRETLCDLLELEGFEVVVAVDGKDGVVKAIDHDPDLIVCDIMMPEMDGFEVVRTIRKARAGSLMPIIFLSARTSHADIRQGMNLGADDFLTKPFENDELIATIEARLEKVAGHRQNLDALSGSLRAKDEIIREYSFINSHHIRQPLANVIGLVQLLADEPEFAGNELMNNLISETETLDRRIRELNDLLSARRRQENGVGEGKEMGPG